MQKRIRKFKQLYYNPETDKVPDAAQFNNKISYIFNKNKELVGIKSEDPNMSDNEFSTLCNLIRRQIICARETPIMKFDDEKICKNVRLRICPKKEEGISTYSDAHRRCYARKKELLEEKRKEIQTIKELFSVLPFFKCEFF